ncbi:MAG: response regulator, partial [Chloroflexota bacterium]
LHWLQQGGRPDVVLADYPYYWADREDGELYRWLCECQTDGSALVALIPFGLKYVPPSGIYPFPVSPARQTVLFDLLKAAFNPQAGAAPETFDYPERIESAPGLSILLAEDDPLNRQALTLRLERLGYKVEAVANGLAVIQAIAEGRYDIVFMDYQMPELDGLFATRYIRENYAPDRQPFIIGLTADARQEAREALLAAGANLYLTKPVKGEDLARVLKQALDFIQSERRTFWAVNHLLQDDPSRAGAPIDEAIFSDLAESVGGDDLSNLLVLMALFFENSQKQMQAIRDSLVKQNWQQLRYDLHTMKGSAELMGAARLARRCKQIELLAVNGRTGRIPQDMQQLEYEYTQVYDALQARYAQILQTNQPGSAEVHGG